MLGLFPLHTCTRYYFSSRTIFAFISWFADNSKPMKVSDLLKLCTSMKFVIFLSLCLFVVVALRRVRLPMLQANNHSLILLAIFHLFWWNSLVLLICFDKQIGIQTNCVWTEFRYRLSWKGKKRTAIYDVNTQKMTCLLRLIDLSLATYLLGIYVRISIPELFVPKKRINKRKKI